MTRCKVSCPRDGQQLLDHSKLVIDDFEEVYRFTCPKCEQPVDKALDDHVRSLLRHVGVPTIDELCESFAGVLNDEQAVARWMLSLA